MSILQAVLAMQQALSIRWYAGAEAPAPSAGADFIFDDGDSFIFDDGDSFVIKD